MNYVKVGLVVAAVAFVTAFSVTVYNLGNDLATERAKSASKQESLDRLGQRMKEANAALAKSEAERVRLSNLDTKYTKTIEEAYAKISDLQRDVDSGRVRLYLSGGVRPTTGANETNDPSLGDDSACELGAAARSSYFTLKREMNRQRSQLMFFQELLGTEYPVELTR